MTTCFVNELLVLTSQMVGDELDEQNFHTLSNICELNVGEEPEEFFWGAYGRGMSKAAGIRGLAKLSRWDDRSKIALKNSLLPYLTGLIECAKVDPKDAVALNRLAEPVEYHVAGTKEFAEAMRQMAGPDPVVISELVEQYLDDNPDWASDSTVETLNTLANEAMGPDSDLSLLLGAAGQRYAKIREVGGETSDYHDVVDSQTGRDARRQEREDQDVLKSSPRPIP